MDIPFKKTLFGANVFDQLQCHVYDTNYEADWSVVLNDPKTFMQEKIIIIIL